MEGQELRVTLPGKLFQRGDRWWWSVKLPGEDQAKSRPLKPKGAKAAASDTETAEKIALEMWEQAVREQAQRQIAAESGRKVAALKAQFLEKVRHFTEVVERATAKAEAEARARAEAEAKLQRIAQTADRKTEDEGPGAGIPDGGLRTAGYGLTETHAGTHQSAIHNPQYEQTGYCECCESARFSATQLKRIDSGQLLCPDCLTALRADASRTRSHLFARRPV